MGKRILVRRRGRGASVFRPPSHKRTSAASYPQLGVSSIEKFDGEVIELTHDPGRNSPLAKLKFESGDAFYIPAPEGISVGQEIQWGTGAPSNIGNILPIGPIPEGTMVSNIELRPGDGGKLARSSGTYGIIVSHTEAGTEIKLRSGRSLRLDNRCRATVGVVAGSGRREKPLMKAGTKYKTTRSRATKWPSVSGKAMISASHPYGGGRHKHAGKPTSVSRDAPPGRKVGNIAPSRTGRGRKRRVKK